MFFDIRAYRGACECTWKYRSISSNIPAQLEIKDNKRSEIWISLVTCGSIHQGHKWLVMTLRKTRDFYVFGCSIMWAILPICEWRCQDIDQVLLHEIIFCQCIQQQWSVREKCFHSEKTAHCSLLVSGRKERKLWSQPSLCQKRLRFHRPIIHSILRPLRR